jgi:hypothetical protein
LPEAETEQEVKALFFLAFGVECEAIWTGMLQWFAIVHRFVQDEKGETASLQVGSVSSDFLHFESFLEVSLIFPLAPLPQFF